MEGLVFVPLDDERTYISYLVEFLVRIKPSNILTIQRRISTLAREIGG